MAPQLPKVVLPKFEIMAKSPVDALGEIRNSLSATAASIEAALPKVGQGGTKGGVKLPKIKGFALSVEEVGPPFMPKISGIVEQVEKTLGGESSQETLSGLASSEKAAEKVPGVSEEAGVKKTVI